MSLSEQNTALGVLRRRCAVFGSEMGKCILGLPVPLTVILTLPVSFLRQPFPHLWALFEQEQTKIGWYSDTGVLLVPLREFLIALDLHVIREGVSSPEVGQIDQELRRAEEMFFPSDLRSPQGEHACDEIFVDLKQ